MGIEIKQHVLRTWQMMDYVRGLYPDREVGICPHKRDDRGMQRWVVKAVSDTVELILSEPCITHKGAWINAYNRLKPKEPRVKGKKRDIPFAEKVAAVRAAYPKLDFKIDPGPPDLRGRPTMTLGLYDNGRGIATISSSCLSAEACWSNAHTRLKKDGPIIGINP